MSNLSIFPRAAYFQLALNDSTFFTDARSNDLLIRPASSNQAILIGTSSNDVAAFRMSASNVAVRLPTQVQGVTLSNDHVAARVIDFGASETRMYYSAAQSNLQMDVTGCNLVTFNSNAVVIAESNANSIAPSGLLHVEGIIYTSAANVQTSDLRLKANLSVIDHALDKIDAIHGYTFERVDKDSGRRHAGVIAQELEQVLPEAIYTNPVTGYKAVAYDDIIGLLIEGMRELRADVNDLRAKLSQP